MKHLKLFENFENITEAEVEKYLQENYPSNWFDSELVDRVHDYIGEDEAENYGGDYEEAYKNLSTGGAVEYDLLEVMCEETSEHFSKDREEKIDKRNINDICHDHLIDTCSWYDKWVFNRRSTEPYKSQFGFGSSYQDLLSKWDVEKNDTGFKL
jgi:hypothetical protein